MNDKLPHRIKHFLIKHGVRPTDTLIVGVSGGADSMALLHCCHTLSLNIVAAHVNYGLRGEDSDADEELVMTFCRNHSIPCETLRVDDSHWKLHEGSTQEAARSIRYDWFNALLEKFNATFTLVAHHANDQTETMLLQFIRGGAGKSIYGMAERNGRTLRPMLPFVKSDILRYLREENIPWRDDESNASDIYSRNFIRHHIVPLIEQLNPEIHTTIQQRSSRMHQEQRLVERAVHQYLEQAIEITGNHSSLEISSLLSTDSHGVILWKWLFDYGFTSGMVEQIADICAAPARSEAAWFYSSTHSVCIQNSHIVCGPILNEETHIVSSLPAQIGNITFDTCRKEDVSFASDSIRQYLDFDLVEFPIRIRTWQAGDRFLPLGASGEQKVSDFLTHAKLESWKKKQVLVLTTRESIAAIIGHRISEPFKISVGSVHCLRITFIT